MPGPRRRQPPRLRATSVTRARCERPDRVDPTAPAEGLPHLYLHARPPGARLARAARLCYMSKVFDHLETRMPRFAAATCLLVLTSSAAVTGCRSDKDADAKAQRSATA